MTYEIPPSRVTRQRPLWPFALVVVTAFAIVGVASVTRLTAGGNETGLLDTPSASPMSGPVVAAGQAAQDVASPAASSPRTPRTLPRHVECVDIDPGPCARVTTAALGALPDSVPRVDGATIRVSLLCDAWLDCPPSHPQGAVVPLGSASFTFDDGGSVAWVNVVGEPRAAAVLFWLAPRAWVVRWTPAPNDKPRAGIN